MISLPDDPALPMRRAMNMRWREPVDTRNPITRPRKVVKRRAAMRAKADDDNIK